jgi:hypothetical protein
MFKLGIVGKVILSILVALFSLIIMGFVGDQLGVVITYPLPEGNVREIIQSIISAIVGLGGAVYVVVQFWRFGFEKDTSVRDISNRIMVSFCICVFGFFLISLIAEQMRGFAGAVGELLTVVIPLGLALLFWIKTKRKPIPVEADASAA